MSRILCLAALALIGCDTVDTISVEIDVAKEAVQEATPEAPIGVFVSVAGEFENSRDYATLTQVICAPADTQIEFTDSGRGCSGPREVAVWLALVPADAMRPCGDSNHLVDASPDDVSAQVQVAFEGNDPEACTSDEDALFFRFEKPQVAQVRGR